MQVRLPEASCVGVQACGQLFSTDPLNLAMQMSASASFGSAHVNVFLPQGHFLPLFTHSVVILDFLPEVV